MLHSCVLICIGHRPIIFKGLGERTGEMHTKETRLGGMLHVGLPARSCGGGGTWNILLALEHVYCTSKLKYRYLVGLGGMQCYERTTVKIVSKRFYMSQATIRN